MRYEWDEAKRQVNIRRHAIDFVDVSRIFENDVVIIEDDRFDYGETRYVAFGLLSGRVIAVVYTEPKKEVIRVISARKATKYETRKYYTFVGN